MTDLNTAMREKYGAGLDEMTASQLTDALKRTIRELDAEDDHRKAISRGGDEARKTARYGIRRQLESRFRDQLAAGTLTKEDFDEMVEGKVAAQ